MNYLESAIFEAKPTWEQVGTDTFTTVINGYGFVLHQHDSKMWLSGLEPSTVKWQQDCHRTIGPRIVCFCSPYSRTGTKQMFKIPATDNFVAYVIMNAHPNMFKKKG